MRKGPLKICYIFGKNGLILILQMIILIEVLQSNELILLNVIFKVLNIFQDVDLKRI